MKHASNELLDKPIISIKVGPKQDEPLSAWDHQKMAWAMMDDTFLKSSKEKKAGIVVVPTGGGKTWLASNWLLKNHVAKGGQLLWLTHRTSLLRQAFKTFIENAFLADPLDKLNLIRISSGEAKWSQVTDQDHIVFSTIQTASYPDNHGFVIQMLKDSPKGLFVVVDEAHHACAPSYFRLIKELQEGGASLLGLTATPVRMNKNDEQRLWKIFEYEKIYQIPMSALINEKILSHPEPVTVKTRVEMERDFTEQDYKYLEQYGELAPKVLESLAKNASRNELIVEHYNRNCQKYGKTIVFAVDTLHAKTLSEEFQKQKIQSDYVDYTRENVQLIMDAFRDKENPIVIVNVEMLTEGFDAPKTHTIFIARPTRSESLLRQMIGRGLRGPASGGNENAYLVTFVDTWKDYHPLDTEIIVSQDLSEPPPEVPEKDRVPLVPIPPELVREAYRLVMSNVKGSFESIYDCLPHSWYSWEEENDDQIGYLRRYVLVFENQVDGFEELHSKIIDDRNFPTEIDEAYAKKIIRDYFLDTNDPIPSTYDLISLLLAYKKNADVNKYTVGEKGKIDPSIVAKQLRNSNFADLKIETDRFYDDENNSLCRVFYPGESGKYDFYEEVFNAMKRISSPPKPPGSDIARLVEELPANLGELRKWPSNEPGYRLNELWDTVTTKNFPKGPPKVSDIRYAKKPLKTYWGFCRYTDGRITLNPIINSPDVPRFVIEFLLYHEILHAYLPYSGHNKDFRAKEKVFVPSDKALEEAQNLGFKLEGTVADYWRVRADQFLDSFYRRFKLSDDLENWRY